MVEPALQGAAHLPAGKGRTRDEWDGEGESLKNHSLCPTLIFLRSGLRINPWPIAGWMPEGDPMPELTDFIDYTVPYCE